MPSPKSFPTLSTMMLPTGNTGRDPVFGLPVSGAGRAVIPDVTAADARAFHEKALTPTPAAAAGEKQRAEQRDYAQAQLAGRTYEAAADARAASMEKAAKMSGAAGR